MREKIFLQIERGCIIMNAEKMRSVKQTVRLNISYKICRLSNHYFGEGRLLFRCLNLSAKSIAFTIVLVAVTIIPAILRIVSNISKIYPLLYFPQNHLR